MCSLFCVLRECLLMNQAQDARPEPEQIPTLPCCFCKHEARWRGENRELRAPSPVLRLPSSEPRLGKWPFSPPKLTVLTPKSHHFHPRKSSLADEKCRRTKGRFYQLVFNVRQCSCFTWMSSRLSHRIFCLSFSHVARYAPS